MVLTALALQGCGAGSPGGAPSAASSGSSGAPSAPIAPGGENKNGNKSGELFVDASPASVGVTVGFDDGNKATRERTVMVNMDSLKAELRAAASSPTTATTRLELFKDVMVDVALEQVQVVSDNNIVVVGRIVGEPDSAVTIAVNNGVMLANFHHADGASYEVRYLDKGLHVIRVPETIAEEQDAPVDAATEPETAQEMAMSEKFQAPGPDSSPLANPVVDVLVAYTPAARTKVGGTDAMNAMIQMGVADTNRAMADSGVALSVRLVGTMETKKNESGNYSSDLTALKGTTDGRWDEVHAERARLGADQVTLVGAYPTATSVLGIGYYKATASTAFTILKYTAFKIYTFGHELGHNLGLAHSDGYVSSAGRFRTIIAYGSYPRIRRYSNPSIPYNGYKTGDSSHNEASILNANAVRVSNLVAPILP